MKKQLCFQNGMNLQKEYDFAKRKEKAVETIKKRQLEILEMSVQK